MMDDFEIRDFRDLTADSLCKADRLRQLLKVLRDAIPEDWDYFDAQVLVCQELAESLRSNLCRQFEES